MIQAVIFDCFGVLLPNTSGAFAARHAALLGGNTEFIDALNVELDYDRMSRAEFFETLHQKTGLPVEQIRSELDDGLIANTELIDFIENIKSSYKIGLLSNASNEEIAFVDKAGIGNLFEARTVSAQVQVVKPDPKIYQLAASSLQVPVEACIFVDDSAPNLPPAEKLGMKTILYQDFEAFKQQFYEIVSRK